MKDEKIHDDQYQAMEVRSVTFRVNGLPYQKVNSMTFVSDRFVTANKIIRELSGRQLPGGIHIEQFLEGHKSDMIAHANGLAIHGGSEQFAGYINITLEKIACLDRSRTFRVEAYQDQDRELPYFTLEPVSGDKLGALIQTIVQNPEKLAYIVDLDDKTKLHYANQQASDAANGYEIEEIRWNNLREPDRLIMLRSCQVMVENDLQLSSVRWGSLPETLKPLLANAMYANVHDLDGNPLSYFVKIDGQHYLGVSGSPTRDLALAQRFSAHGGERATKARLTRVFAKHKDAHLIDDCHAVAHYLKSDLYAKRCDMGYFSESSNTHASVISESDYFDWVENICRSVLGSGPVELGIKPDEITRSYQDGLNVWDCLKSIEDQWVTQANKMIRASMDAMDKDIFTYSKALSALYENDQESRAYKFDQHV